MPGLILAAVIALAAGASSGPREPTAAQLAVCAKAVDQPICLLRLAAQSNIHQSYRENIAIGYAPAVLAAIGPDPADDPADPVRKILRQPFKAAAIQALIADHDRAPPADALAPIRAIRPDKARDPADQSHMEKYAASQRIQAYRALWQARHGETALPPAHEPSAALLKQALIAWRAELAIAGDDGDADELARAFRDVGEAASADAIAPPAPADEVEVLVEAGRYMDAAAALDRLRDDAVGPGRAAPGNPSEARLEAGLKRALYSMSEGRLIQEAAAAGQANVAVSLAEKTLRRWLGDSPTHAGPAGGSSFSDGLWVAADLMLIVEKAPRAQALDWVARVDAAGRMKADPMAPVNAVAAMRAWTRLGEARRAAAMMAVWAPDIQAAQACGPPLAKTCTQRQALSIPMILTVQPLSTPWDELAPAADHRPGTTSLLAGGRAGIDARLATVQDPWQRMLPLFNCASEAVEAKDLPLAAYCAHRLAAEASPQPKVLLPGMPPIRPERVNAILRVARGAKQQKDAAIFTDMMSLAFDLAAREPEETVGPAPILEDIAIAELREQGRL